MLSCIIPLSAVHAFTQPPYIIDNDLPPTIIPEEDVVLPVKDIDDSSLSQSRKRLMSRIEQMSASIDGFFLSRFFGEDIDNEENYAGSRGKISFDINYRTDDQFDFKLGVKLKIDLPYTNDRLKLLISSDDEQDAEDTIIDSVEQPEYNTALRFIIQESGKWKNDADIGLRGGLPFNPFLRYRVERRAYFNYWNLRIRQAIFARREEGVGAKSEIRFDYPVDHYQLIRVDGSAEYLEKQDYFDLEYNATYFRELDIRRAVAVSFKGVGDDETHARIDSYSLTFRYRQQIWRPWFFTEVSQAFEWDEENEFNTVPVTGIKFEVLLDNQY